MQNTTLVQRSRGSELRALLTIAKKEWTIFRRYPSWVVALVVWPIIFPLGYIFTARALGGPDGSGVAAFSSRVGTTDYFSYILIGTTMYMWLNLTLWDVGFQLRNEQMRGTLESNWLCPVWRISILLGGAITKLGVALLFLALMVIQFQLVLGVSLLRGNVGLHLLIIVLTIASIYGLAIGFASLVIRFKEANAMVFLVRGVFMLFCGIIYPVTVMPGWMQNVGAFIPLTYSIRSIRAVSLNGATFGDVRADLLRLLIFAMVLPLIGWTAFRSMERRARRTGTLGQY